MLFWKVRSAWHHAANSDDLVVSNSFSASQAEALDVEILLSSQGSRIVSVEKSSIVYSFLVRAHNLQILIIERGSTPRIDRSILATLLFDAITSVKRSTPRFSRFAPHYGRLFRPLSPIVISVTTVRCHDVALPSISATVFPTPKPHGLTIVELRVVYTRYPTGSTDRYSPAAIIKANPFTQNLHCESSISIRAPHHHCSCPLKHLFRLLQSSRASCSPVFVPDVEKKLRVDRKQKSIQAATHDSVFGRARVVSLDIVRDIPLYRRRTMFANSCACAHSSPASSQTAVR
jgi:hypothetical protein